MTRVLELVALGFAGGTTFTLLLLSGGRRANAPRPEPILRTQPRDRQHAS
jgi:hypothetical protein